MSTPSLKELSDLSVTFRNAVEAKLDADENLTERFQATITMDEYQANQSLGSHLSITKSLYEFLQQPELKEALETSAEMQRILGDDAENIDEKYFDMTIEMAEVYAKTALRVIPAAELSAIISPQNRTNDIATAMEARNVPSLARLCRPKP